MHTHLSFFVCVGLFDPWGHPLPLREEDALDLPRLHKVIISVKFGEYLYFSLSRLKTWFGWQQRESFEYRGGKERGQRGGECRAGVREEAVASFRCMKRVDTETFLVSKRETEKRKHMGRERQGL